MKKKKLFKELNKITPYRVVSIRNEYGIERGEFLTPYEEYTLNWLKENGQGSASFNVTALNHLGHRVSIEEVWAFQEYLKETVDD